MSRKLNIGGTSRLPGWEVFEIGFSDIVEQVRNFGDLSMFADNTFRGDKKVSRQKGVSDGLE